MKKIHIHSSHSTVKLVHLRWKKSHVFGHSMGAPISCNLAAIALHRLRSLALLNVTGGGFQCFPKVMKLLYPHTYLWN